MQHALRALATALESGLPVNDPALIATLPPRVRATLQAGRELAPSLKGLVDEGSIAVIAAAERSGFLPKALRLVADDLDERRARKRRALLALAYPAFLIVMASLVLPLPVAVTGGFGAYAGAALPGIIAVAAALIALFVVVPRLPPRALAQVPIFGSIVIDNARACVLEILGRQLAAGVPMTVALPSSVNAGLSSWRAGDIADGVADALRDVIHEPRIALAEKTGTLDRELPRIATELRERAKRRALALTVVFGVLCFLAVAVTIGRAVIAASSSYFEAIE